MHIIALAVGAMIILIGLARHKPKLEEDTPRLRFKQNKVTLKYKGK